MSSDTDFGNLLAYRELFPVTREYTYLNCAAFGPTPTPVVEAVAAYLSRAQSEPPDEYMDDLLAVRDRFKASAARLIGAQSADEIVQIPGTAYGINTAACGLPLAAGDNVLLLDGDYPAVIYPWLNQAPRGILTKLVPCPNGGLDLDLLRTYIDARTRAVCVSTAMFATGFRNDVEALGRLCQEREIFLVVDAIQTLGYVPLDVQRCNIDILACGSHKWLLCPPGAGFLYCRRDLLPQLQLGPYVGALSVVDAVNFLPYNFTLQETAERFSTSVWPFAAWVAMDASLRLLLEIGIDPINRHVLALVRAFADDLSERGFSIISPRSAESVSGLLIVGVRDPQASWERLKADRIVVSPRGKGIRIAPNFFNLDSEVPQLGEALERAEGVLRRPTPAHAAR